MSAPRFRRPGRPVVEPLLLMHRPSDPEHAIAFGRKVWMNGEAGWEDLLSFPARDLQEFFPQYAEQFFDVDAFHSVNGFIIPRNPRTGRVRASPAIPSMPRASHEARCIRYLCAAYTDLDCYTADVTIGQAIGALIDMQDRGQLPPASMLTRSGRGVWAFWFLRDREGQGPVRAWRERVPLYESVQRAIYSRVRELGADQNALDVSRLSRIPGSVNSAAGVDGLRVQYWIQADQGGGPFLYTLDELAEFLDVPRVQRAAAMRRLSDPSVNPEHRLKGQRGSLGRWTHELHRFERLRDLRKAQGACFAKGHRGRALRFYAGVLVNVQRMAQRQLALGHQVSAEQLPIAAMQEREIREAVRALVLECEPVPGDRITRADADSAVRAALGKKAALRNVKHTTIAEWLAITPAEGAELGWPCAQKFGPMPVPPDTRTRADARALRRELIAAACRAMNAIPPLRDLAALLEPYGMRATVRTLSKDLVALGLLNPRGRIAREAELSAPPPLFREAPQ